MTFESNKNDAGMTCELSQHIEADLSLTVLFCGSLQVGSSLGGVSQLIAPHGPADAAQLVVHFRQLTVSDQHGLTLSAAQGCLQLLLCQLHIQAWLIGMQRCCSCSQAVETSQQACRVPCHQIIGVLCRPSAMFRQLGSHRWARRLKSKMHSGDRDGNQEVQVNTA